MRIHPWLLPAVVIAFFALLLSIILTVAVQEVASGETPASLVAVRVAMILGLAVFSATAFKKDSTS